MATPAVSTPLRQTWDLVQLGLRAFTPGPYPLRVPTQYAGARHQEMPLVELIKHGRT